MFGIIPKSMWNKLLPSDENNLIPMVANLFVLTAYGKHMIFDIGLGDTLSDKEKKIYGTDGVTFLEDGLTLLGLTPDHIEYVILSHLHTDHAGGAVKLVDGKYVPRFPKAKYIIDRREWDAAIKPNERTAAVYIPERLNALREHGAVQFIEGTTELWPGIKAVFTGGHSEGHYAIEMNSDGECVYYYADIFPTTHHLRVPFIPATDIYPVASMDVKRKALPRFIKENVVLAFDHDINYAFGRVKEVDGKVTIEPVETVTTPTS